MSSIRLDPNNRTSRSISSEGSEALLPDNYFMQSSSDSSSVALPTSSETGEQERWQFQNLIAEYDIDDVTPFQGHMDTQHSNSEYVTWSAPLTTGSRNQTVGLTRMAPSDRQAQITNQIVENVALHVPIFESDANDSPVAEFSNQIVEIGLQNSDVVNPQLEGIEGIMEQNVDQSGQSGNERRTRSNGAAQEVDAFILMNRRKRKLPSYVSGGQENTGRKSRNVVARKSAGRPLRLQDSFYSNVIEMLFENQRNLGKYSDDGFDSGLGDVETFKLEFNVWKECRNIIMENLPKNMYIDGRLWGNRFGRMNTVDLYKAGEINSNYVPPDKHQKSSDVMRRIVSQNRKIDTFLFLIVSEVKDIYVGSGKDQLCHCNVLVVKRTEDGISYFLFEPCEMTQTYLPMHFLLGLKSPKNPKQAMPSFNCLNIIFGRQKMGDKDCFHRGIDWIAQLVDGRAHLDISLCSQFPVSTGYEKRRIVRL